MAVFVLVTCHVSPATLHAVQRPSVFRNVVLADSESGVRVISVEEGSQAHLADLRPEDIIVRVENTDVRTIDEFAAVSAQLRGKVEQVQVLVFRNGSPVELTPHLYSYPVLRTWKIEVVPEHDIRFADPATGRDYWLELARGYEESHDPGQALNAYLNALHNMPQEVGAALNASRLYTALSRDRLKAGDLAGGIDRLNRAVLIMNELFTRRLTVEQMESVKHQLIDALESLRDASRAMPHSVSPAASPQR